MGNLLAFILLIGPLIVIHELGHLVAAKLVDVKVTRFSLGFGPALLKARLGETEYCVAPIPLGGYVSMLGQAPGEEVAAADADRTLPSKPLWARYLVLGAGPAANLILPIIVYFFYYVLTHTAVTPAVVGTIVAGSAAEQADLRQGDRIVAIEGRDVRSWTEMRKRVEKAPGEELKIQVERDGRRLDRVVTPRKTITRNALGVTTAKGRLGIQPVFFAPQIGIIDPESPAYAEGLRTGDVVTSINGEPVRTVEELQQMLAVTGDALVRLTYLRAQSVRAQGSTLLFYDSHHAQLLPRKKGESVTGLLPGGTFVRSVDEGSPAQKAGIKPGDQILSADGAPLSQWVTLNDIFGRKGDEAVTFTVHSPGERPRTLDITLEKRTWKDIYSQDQSEPWFGAYPYDKSYVSDPEPIRGRFTYALGAAVEDTGEVIGMMWTALVQMLTLERSVDELSSVVGLYKVAGTAYEQGPGHFLLLIALLSINLGIINLLPIPVLDGGHLLFFTIEAVRRRPLGQRAREISSAVGFVVILLLLLTATRNDILRHWL